ncbi:MAG: response regulator [Anaerolineae bacterium]|nr:response regulator [Anaerolineae bacterium]
MNAPYILVIDDNSDSQGLIALILRHYQISFDMVSSAEDGLMMLSCCDYSAVVVDLVLPDMDGWTFLERMRRNPRSVHTPCLAVTAFHHADVDLEALQAGFAAYFFKPLDAAAFIDTLRRVSSEAVAS